ERPDARIHLLWVRRAGKSGSRRYDLLSPRPSLHQHPHRCQWHDYWPAGTVPLRTELVRLEHGEMEIYDVRARSGVRERLCYGEILRQFAWTVHFARH